MITNLLDYMYSHNIQVKKVNDKTKLIYSPGQLNEDLRLQIKQNKKAILQRMKENDEAKRQGFIVYNEGELYEYRYGRGAYLYIERLQNGLADAWRANFKGDENTPYKIKIVARDEKFMMVFEKAIGFINWLNKHQ